MNKFAMDGSTYAFLNPMMLFSRVFGLAPFKVVTNPATGTTVYKVSNCWRAYSIVFVIFYFLLRLRIAFKAATGAVAKILILLSESMSVASTLSIVTILIESNVKAERVIAIVNRLSSRGQPRCDRLIRKIVNYFSTIYLTATVVNTVVFRELYTNYFSGEFSITATYIVENCFFSVTFFQMLYLMIVLKEKFTYVNLEIESKWKIKNSDDITAFPVLKMAKSRIQTTREAERNLGARCECAGHSVRMLAHTHSCLCDVSERLNQSASVQVTIGTARSFATLTVGCFVLAKLFLFSDISFTRGQLSAFVMMLTQVVTHLAITLWLSTLVVNQASEQFSFILYL